jgi:hypothetical protein
MKITFEKMGGTYTLEADGMDQGGK